MEVMPSKPWYGLAPLVYYDDYDFCGYLLDIRHGTLHELTDQDTRILCAVLCCTTLAEGVLALSPRGERLNPQKDVSALLTRLQSQRLLEPKAIGCQLNPRGAPSSSRSEQTHADRAGQAACHPAVTLRQRVVGAGHMISVLNELCQEEGLYKAYQYIQKLKTNHIPRNAEPVLFTNSAFQLAQDEYWFYRLVTGLIERRIAHLLGQFPGEEGLCMVKAFSLCAYLLTLGIPAQIILARPKYGSRTGFKLHVWGEIQGKPLNEVPNIRDRYRVIAEFPSY